MTNTGERPSHQCFSSTPDAQTQMACLSTLRTNILQFLYLHTSLSVSPVYKLWSTCHSELYQLRRAEQAESWQVRFGVKENKEIHLKENNLPVPTGCEVWQRQLQLRKEILGWSLTALKFQNIEIVRDWDSSTCKEKSWEISQGAISISWHNLTAGGPADCQTIAHQITYCRNYMTLKGTVWTLALKSWKNIPYTEGSELPRLAATGDCGCQ